MKLIIDTREQQPLLKSVFVSRTKLEEGDYNLDELVPFIVIERKNPADLYQSIVQGHNRFTDEIMRARLQGKVFYIVVECSKADFLRKYFHGSHYCKLSGGVLSKIISTMEDKYGVIFIWCNGRIMAWRTIISIIELNCWLYLNKRIVINPENGLISYKI
jgi:ERCC4-type nuclease